jgi:hypothetical protein
MTEHCDFPPYHCIFSNIAYCKTFAIRSNIAHQTIFFLAQTAMTTQRASTDPKRNPVTFSANALDLIMGLGDAVGEDVAFVWLVTVDLS